MNFLSDVSAGEFVFKRRVTLVSIGVILIAIGGYILGRSADAFGATEVTIGLVLGCAFVLVVMRDWTVGIYLLFAWLIVEDSLRKYTGGVIVLYFIKDAMLLVIYLSYFLHRAIRHEPLINWRNIIGSATVLLAIWGLISGFYTGSNDLIVAIVGIRMWFIYFPLVFLGIDFAQSPQRVQRLMKLIVISAGVISLFGLAQVLWGNQILNPASVDYDAKLFLEKSGVTGLTLTRPTSLFIDPGRYGKYGIMILCVLLGALLYFYLSEKRNRHWRNWCASVLGLVFVMNMLSGARTAYLAAPMIVVGFVMLYQSRGLTHNGSSSRKTAFVLLFAMVVIVGLFVLLLTAYKPDYLEATLDFASTTVPYISDHYDLHSANIAFSLSNFGLIGRGVGSASLGITYFTALIYEGVETGYASVIIEFGVVGLLLWLLISIDLVRLTWKESSVLRGTPFIGIAMSALILQATFMLLLFMLGASIYQDYLINAHLWMFTGMTFGLARLYRVGNFDEKEVTKKPVLQSAQ